VPLFDDTAKANERHDAEKKFFRCFRRVVVVNDGDYSCGGGGLRLGWLRAILFAGVR
jgi:hypothetical protein